MQIFIELITLPEGRLLVDLLIWVWGGYSAEADPAHSLDGPGGRMGNGSSAMRGSGRL